MNTPIEKYKIEDTEVFVKREDLVNPFPSSNNAKFRGVYEEIRDMHERGVKKIGVLDTELSRAGWTVASVSKLFDIKTFTFTPRNANNDFFKAMCRSHGAEVVEQVGSKMSIRYARALKYMKEVEGTMLADKLRLKNAVFQVANEVRETIPKDLLTGSVVACVGSGTMIAGVMKGLRSLGCSPTVYGILVTTQVHIESRRRYIRQFEPYYWDGDFKLVFGDYEYKQSVALTPPFPCDIYYDRKAWEYLVKHINELPKPILFWNVGGEWHQNDGMKNLRGDGITSEQEVEKWLRENNKCQVENVHSA